MIRKVHKKGADPDPLRGLFEADVEGKPAVVEYEPDPDLRDTERALQARIQSMLYERTALSKKPAKLIEQDLKALREEDRITPDLVFRDPYVLDFLGLRGTYSELRPCVDHAMIHNLKMYPAYTDSGVPWLGQVPAHWEVRRQRHAVDMRVSNVDKHSHADEQAVRLDSATTWMYTRMIVLPNAWHSCRPRPRQRRLIAFGCKPGTC